MYIPELLSDTDFSVVWRGVWSSVVEEVWPWSVDSSVSVMMNTSYDIIHLATPSNTHYILLRSVGGA